MLQSEKPQKSDKITLYVCLYASVWADNADACAKQYAGTGALKTDFTRCVNRYSQSLSIFLFVHYQDDVTKVLIFSTIIM